MSIEVRFDGEKATLARGFPTPSIKDVKNQIRAELGTKIRRWKDSAGMITDAAKIYEIVCLMRALSILCSLQNDRTPLAKRRP